MNMVDEDALNVLLADGVDPLTALAASIKDEKPRGTNASWLYVAMLVGFAVGLLVIMLGS
jgi:hypothetical protein